MVAAAAVAEETELVAVVAAAASAEDVEMVLLAVEAVEVSKVDVETALPVEVAVGTFKADEAAVVEVVAVHRLKVKELSWPSEAHHQDVVASTWTKNRFHSRTQTSAQLRTRW